MTVSSTTDTTQNRFPPDTPANASRTDIVITDPRDGTLVGAVATAGPDEIAEAVTRARQAFPGWSSVPAAQRGLALRAAAIALAECKSSVADTNTRETGRPFDEALAGVEAGVDTLLQYAELGPLHRGRSLRGERSSADYTVPEPRGVAVVLTPWNDPVAIAAGLVGAAIACGNTVVHKPSERCPHVGARFGELLSAAFPPGVLVTVIGTGQTGQDLISLPGIDVIAHVGSTATGRTIARIGALTGAHVVRENGGNDPLIVDGDVDPVWAAQQAAIGAFANSGQLCTSVERIFVHCRVAEAFIRALVEEARKLNRGHALGPLVDTRLREAVHAQVAASRQAGAVAQVGGDIPAGPGSYYPATVLTECDAGMPVMTEETFGPVAAVQIVPTSSAALELAAHDRYGLAATVLTASIEHAHRAVRDLPVGTVKINAVFGSAPGGSAQPRGDSGSGFGYGPELLDELTTTKVVHLGVPVQCREP